METSSGSENTILDQLIKQGGFDIPDGLRRAFAPASCCIKEWHLYWLELPGVDVLRVGNNELIADHGEWFCVQFRNELGLAQIQPLRNGQPVCPSLVVEVISPKFPEPAIHYEFFKMLLDDLFLRAVRLPFTIDAKTEQSVREALRPPTPLFTYYFLRQYARELEAALRIILANPHRLLVDEENLVNIASVQMIDAEILLDILHTPQRWEKTENHPIAKRLRGYAPRQILQRQSQETLDTPENRFILHFLKQLLTVGDELFAQRWWKNVPGTHCRAIQAIYSLIQQSRIHPMFTEVGEQRLLPLHSQVMLRRDGYRQMLELWQIFQCARRPLFEPLQKAITLRSVDQLYEHWAFLALVEQIGLILGIDPVMELRTSDEFGLNWQSAAVFGKNYRLTYNPRFARNQAARHSYSITLRPDFIWEVDGVPTSVLDAKFRLSLDGVDDETAEQKTSPVLEDLYKMHTYRDALAVKSAVVVYPGDQNRFFPVQLNYPQEIGIRDYFPSSPDGIGAISLNPTNAFNVEE
jgi:hypothetical protein